MRLSEIITLLDREVAGRGSYTVTVWARKLRAPGADEAEAEAYSVLDVAIDEQDSHIDLVTEEGLEQSPDPASVFTAEHLLEHCRALEPRCGEWSVYVRSTIEPIEPGWGVRIDAPVVGMAANHDTRAVALLQFPPEQWRDAV